MPGAKPARSVSLVDEVLSRDRLVTDLETALYELSGPQLVVGRTGAGKTMVLLKLVQHLARRGQVPVVISCRDIDTSRRVDIRDEAYKKFRQQQTARTNEQSEKVWMWLCRSNLVTIVVDDLEKAGPNAALFADLDAAAEAGFHVMAASRPGGVPSNRRSGRVDLAPLDQEDIRHDMTQRLRRWASHGARAEKAEEVARQIAVSPDVSDTPYYLALARVLADTGELLKVELDPARDARIALLSTYRAALEAGSVRPDAGIAPDVRREAFVVLEAVAFVRLQDVKTRAPIEDELTKLHLIGGQDNEDNSTPLDSYSAIEYAERLGVLEERSDGKVRFAHPTTLAYFAACFLVRNQHQPELWGQLASRKQVGSSAHLALVFAAAAGAKAGVAESACNCLLKNVATESGVGNGSEPRRTFVAGDGEHRAAPDNRPHHTDHTYERLLLLETAATLAQGSATCTAAVERAIIADVSTRVRPGGISRDQVRLVRALARTASVDAHGALWNFATASPEYQIRREATKALILGGSAVADACRDRVERALRDGKALRERVQRPTESDRGEPFSSLRAVALLLPSLRSSCRDHDKKDQLDRYQDDLWLLSRRLTTQLGLEASIADGFKLDALRDPLLTPDADALEMLKPGKKRARFWFSRVLLLQAVAVRCADGRFNETDWRVILEAEQDPHPFVREAARLCKRGRETDKWEQYVWEDMTDVVSGGRSKLATVAKQLIADIVLLLNLNDLGSDTARLKFGKSNRLPACLQSSYDRREIVGFAEPSSDCPFRRGDNCMCPYAYHPPKGGFRRELSLAFCRDQQIHAQPVPWQPSLRTKELRGFWRSMESMSRF